MEIVENIRATGSLAAYYGLATRVGDNLGHPITTPITNALRRFGSLRYLPSWNNHLANDEFDQQVAACLQPTDQFIGFVGGSLRSFRQIRKLGCQTLVLHAANSHVEHVFRQHRKAIDRFGIEDTWLNQTQCQKTKREYALADFIYVASDYTRDTFLAEGVPLEKLKSWQLQIPSRFKPSLERPTDQIFRIIYVGSLTVMKGIPVLMAAFARLPQQQIELTLVGGWASPGMRRYVQAWLARNPNIKICSGDPLPYLQQADVFVHPTYEDGFAYAPAEALACGVPVIVSEDTGMKSLVREGINGYVVATGNVDALVEKLLQLRNKPLAGNF